MPSTQLENIQLNKHERNYVKVFGRKNLRYAGGVIDISGLDPAEVYRAIYIAAKQKFVKKETEMVTTPAGIYRWRHKDSRPPTVEQVDEELRKLRGYPGIHFPDYFKGVPMKLSFKVERPPVCSLWLENSDHYDTQFIVGVDSHDRDNGEGSVQSALLTAFSDNEDFVRRFK